MSRRVHSVTPPMRPDTREWHTLPAHESVGSQRYFDSSAKNGSNIRTFRNHGDHDKEVEDGSSIHRTHLDYDHSKTLPSRARDPGDHSRAGVSPSTSATRPFTTITRPTPPPITVRDGMLGRFQPPHASSGLPLSYSAVTQSAVTQHRTDGLARRDGGNENSYRQMQQGGHISHLGGSSHISSTPDRGHSEVIMPPHLRAPFVKRQPGAESNGPRAEQGKREEHPNAKKGKDAVVPEPPLSMNAGLGAKSVKSELPYPCTYTECTLGFKSFKQLKSHKKQEHDYCAVCDMDFDDDVDLIQHRIDSTINQEGKHTACNVCGDDFGSTAGRDMHIKIMHRSRQQITCPGCGAEFDRGANFVSHVWNNQCPDRSGLVSSEIMSKGRAYAALELEKQEQVDRSRYSRIQNEDVDDHTDSSVSGGVPVSKSLLDQLDDDLGPTHDGRPNFGNTYKDVEDESICGSAGSNQTEIPSVNKSRQQLASYLEAFPPLTNDKNAKREGGAMVAKTAETPQSIKNSESNAPRSATGSIFGRQRLEGTDWDDFLFEKDFTEKYMCPFERCGVFHEDVATLKAHLVSGWHFGTDHRCVKCLKLFQSPVALIAHMESSSARCNIRETQQYANLIYIISGGFLDIDEHGTLLDDNQLKLVAPTRAKLIEQHKEREKTRQERENRLMARN